MTIATFEVPVMKTTQRGVQYTDIYLVNKFNLIYNGEYTEFERDKSTGKRIATKMTGWILHIKTPSLDDIDISFSAPSNLKEFKTKRIRSVEKPSDDGDIIQYDVYELYTDEQEDL